MVLVYLQNLLSASFVIGRQKRSGSVVEFLTQTEGPRVQASPASLHCVLEHYTLILA